MKIEFKTDRLILKPLGTKYLYSTHEYASDLETTRYMIHLPNKSLDETKAFLSMCDSNWEKEDNKNLEFAILFDEIHIGAISLSIYDDFVAEFGWVLNRKYQKQGFAIEAATSLMEYAKKELKIKKIMATCDSFNYNSFRLIEKLGLKKVREEPRIYHDEREDSITFIYELELY